MAHLPLGHGEGLGAAVEDWAKQNHSVRNFADAVQQSLLELRLSRERWAVRGAPCGLLEHVDEPLGYESEPAEFRAFCWWGVDGVYDGLWIDDPEQTHEPFVVLLSPMDFEDPVRLIAATVEEWLVVAEDPSFDEKISAPIAARAARRRQDLGLPSIG